MYSCKVQWIIKAPALLSGNASCCASLVCTVIHATDKQGSGNTQLKLPLRGSSVRVLVRLRLQVLVSARLCLREFHLQEYDRASSMFSTL